MSLTFQPKQKKPATTEKPFYEIPCNSLAVCDGILRIT